MKLMIPQIIDIQARKLYHDFSYGFEDMVRDLKEWRTGQKFDADLVSIVGKVTKYVEMYTFPTWTCPTHPETLVL